ncbi:tetratricopeptide repeat protein [Chitinophaga japonensis]|uniref:Tetratricopeptide repeat protein n=1 Tax=Chitinophaga japonensis TaxID=104662 RepID=A0A562TBM5_CHIJA|nr:tetratricopeptide repeat protein [Chitinophaga japonensis]TWI90684.1 tetratricopeptide repeat protein [Chitinophaga japonensis]
MRIFLSLILLSIAFTVTAREPVYDFNTRCQQAYEAIMQLRINDGKALLAAEKQEHPDNLIPYFLDNYADFFPLFFNEDPAMYAATKGARATRLSRMEQGPDSSPYHLFTQAAIHFQWAMVRIKFGEKWDAGWEIRKAYMLLKDNQRKFPQFQPNSMLLGAMQTVFGTIPDGYKWVSNILGMKGSIRQGMDNLQSFIDSNAPLARLFRPEAYYYYCYLKQFMENNPDELWQFIRQKQLDTRNNYLFAIMVASLAATNQKAVLGIAVLTDRNDNVHYVDIPYADCLLGQLKLARMDDDAHVYLERFIRRYKGKFYLKHALQRLSWYYYLHGNMDAANKYRAMILTRGSTEADEDKQAQKEAKSGKWPNPLLLKARLLSDGGLFQEALKQMQTKKAADFALLEEKLEYAYRLGRIYDEMGMDDQAIAMYEATVKVGANRPEYYAARSALQMGNIYEKRGDKAKARECYQACLNMEGHDYKNSLDQRAKAGLQRVK